MFRDFCDFRNQMIYRRSSTLTISLLTKLKGLCPSPPSYILGVLGIFLVALVIASLHPHLILSSAGTADVLFYPIKT